MTCFRSVYFQFLVLCTSLSSLVDSIELLNKAERTKMRSTQAPSGTVPSTTPKSDSGLAIYRLKNPNTGTTCILLITDAVVEVKFKLHDIDTQHDSFIPEKPKITGDCSQDEFEKMTLAWPGYELTMTFAKTPGGEHWYMKNVDLKVSTDISQFHGINTRSKYLFLYNSSMVIPTPVGKSYVCDDEVDIDMNTDPADNPPSNVRGTLLLRMLHVQAFMYRSENFSTPFQCKSQRSFRSETAPIAVGSTLAIVALAMVTGYGAFRYFKVKNVQYNTME